MKRMSVILLTLLMLITTFAAPMSAGAEGEKVPLELMVRRNAAVNVAADENLIWRTVADMFNLELTFIDVDSGAWSEKFSLMLTSGDYPDIITKTLRTPLFRRTLSRAL